jgi:hypothetical protein
MHKISKNVFSEKTHHAFSFFFFFNHDFQFAFLYHSGKVKKVINMHV